MSDAETRKGANLFSGSPRPYRLCSRCVMDTSDPEITFDEQGVCNHCRYYECVVRSAVHHGEKGRMLLQDFVASIKREGAGKRYDCVLGLSGGIDSTYTAYLVRKLGLRPLAVHLDNGWNSELAVHNIENIVKKLELDLHTVVLDWEEFRRLQLAFLRASTPDSEIPTDHAIVATLHRTAVEQKVGWIIEGSNFVTELMVPPTWSNGHSDWRYIKHVNDHFGGKRLATYPHYTYFDRLVYFPLIRKVKRLYLLNYLDYNKAHAKEVVMREFGWRDYGGKHYESIYTRFYQGYILPRKFGFDKRRPHLSCLVNAGQITRETALRDLEYPAISPDQLIEDRAFVLKKLGLTETEFEEVMAAERRTFWDYPSYGTAADRELGLRAADALSALPDRLRKLGPACVSSILQVISLVPRSIRFGRRAFRDPQYAAKRIRSMITGRPMDVG